MRFNIGTRLFLIVSLISVAILLLNAALTRWQFQRDFLAYVEDVDRTKLAEAAAALRDIYVADAGWDRFRDNPGRWRRFLRNTTGLPEPRGRERPPPRPRGERPPRPDNGKRGGRPPPPDPLQIGQRYSLLGADGNTIIGDARPEDGGLEAPIIVDGQTVGTLHAARLPGLEAPVDKNFDRQQLQSIYTTLAIAVVIGALLSAVFARQLTRPIRALTQGANAITKGNYDTRIDVAREDELGALAHDFNRLAETLAQNRESRRQWIADIAHELRTPLSILHGELAAVEDGMRTFNDETRRSLQAEIDRLSALVTDLHELSVSDEGRLTVDLQRLNVAELLGDVLVNAAARLEAANLKLVTDISAAPASADPNRLEQLFANLIENTLRYTQSPGELHVSCGQQGGDIVIEFADSQPGVPDGALDRLFDRLYRVDASRSRETGGSGLGLAICQAIVDAHGGAIEARHSPFGGVAISISIPAETR